MEPVALVTDELRAQMVRRSWRAFAASPLVGAGVEPLGAYPHNVIVESFLAVGTPGGLAVLALTVMSLVAAWKVWRRDDEHYWIALLFGQQTVLAMLSGALYQSGAYWCLMAAVVVRAAQLSDRKAAAQPVQPARRVAVVG
jgi:O-antigen ligase